MRKRILFTALIFLAISSAAQAAELALEQCVKTAVAQHPDLAAYEAKVMAARAGESQAKAAAQPQANINSSYVRKGTGSGTDTINGTLTGNFDTGFNVSQLITDSGKTKLNIKKAQQTTGSAREDLAEKYNVVVQNVSDAFYNVNSTERAHVVAQRRYNNYENRLKWAQAYYKAGKKAKIEVTKAEADLASSKLALITTKTEIEIAKATLATAMGNAQMKVDKVRDQLEYENWKISEDDAIKTALERRPELMSKKKKVEMAKTEVGIQQKALSPTVSVGGGYNNGGSSFYATDAWNAKVTLSMPITDGGAVNSKVAAARANLKSAEAEYKSLENSVVLEVRTAWQNVVKAEESIVSAREAERKEEENYELAKKRYKAGVGDSLEISDAIESYAAAQAKTILTLYNGHSAQLMLVKAMGGLK